jgi:hypothetical protein
MHIQQSASKNPTVAMIARRRFGRGGVGGDNTTDNYDKDNDNDDKDHNNNATIKQCTGDGGVDDDSGDWQLVVGDVDNNRRRRRQALEGEDNGKVSSDVSGAAVANDSKQWQRTRAAEDNGGGGGDFEGCKRGERIVP